MPRTPNQMEDDARIVRGIIEQEARPVLQSEIRDRLRLQGRLQTKMQIRHTLEAAKARGFIRRNGVYWEACGTEPPATRTAPAVSTTPALGDAMAAELVEVATRLLAVRPCSGVLNEAAQRLYKLALSPQPEPSPVRSVVPSTTEAPPPKPSAAGPVVSSNGLGKHDDDFDIQVFIPSAS